MVKDMENKSYSKIQVLSFVSVSVFLTWLSMQYPYSDFPITNIIINIMEVSTFCAGVIIPIAMLYTIIKHKIIGK